MIGAQSDGVNNATHTFCGPGTTALAVMDVVVYVNVN